MNKIIPISECLERPSLEQIKEKRDLLISESISAIGGFIFDDEFCLPMAKKECGLKHGSKKTK